MRFPARRTLSHAAAALALAIFAAGAAADGEGGRPEGAGRPEGVGQPDGGRHKGRPSRAAAKLLPPEGAADEDACARIDVKFFPAVGRRAERSWFRIKARRLDADTEYSLWADDPSTAGEDLAQFDTFTTDADGRANYVRDTKHEGTLPFDSTLEALGGLAVEVRSADGTTTVLAGTIPDITP